MPDSSFVLTALRNELVTAGLVRRPADSGSLPSWHVEPKGGAPAPGDRTGENAQETAGLLVVTSRLSSELAEGPFNAYRRRIVVDILYRSKGSGGLQAGRTLDSAIRARLIQRADYGVGYPLDQGGPNQILILQANVFGGLSPLSDLDGIRTDVAKYMLEILA